MTPAFCWLNFAPTALGNVPLCKLICSHRRIRIFIIWFAAGDNSAARVDSIRDRISPSFALFSAQALEAKTLDDSGLSLEVGGYVFAAVVCQIRQCPKAQPDQLFIQGVELTHWRNVDDFTVKQGYVPLKGALGRNHFADKSG